MHAQKDMPHSTAEIQPSPMRGGSGKLALGSRWLNLIMTSILSTKLFPVLKNTSSMNSSGDMESYCLPTCKPVRDRVVFHLFVERL